MPHLKGRRNQPTPEILLRHLPLRPLRQRRALLKWSIPDLTARELAWHLSSHSLASVSQLNVLIKHLFIYLTNIYVR